MFLKAAFCGPVMTVRLITILEITFRSNFSQFFFFAHVNNSGEGLGGLVHWGMYQKLKLG